MHLIFTEEEREWIDMKPFDWKIKDGCPKELKKQIERKLKLLKNE